MSLLFNPTQCIPEYFYNQRTLVTVEWLGCAVNHPGFVVSCSILKYVLEESTCPEGCDTSVAPEKAAMEKEKELLGRYKPMLLFSLQDNLGLQLTALYALQGLSHALAFPKGMILRMFMNLYDYEIIDEDAFLKWKEDINDEVPGKRTALFQVSAMPTGRSFAFSEP